MICCIWSVYGFADHTDVDNFIFRLRIKNRRENPHNRISIHTYRGRISLTVTDGPPRERHSMIRRPPSGRSVPEDRHMALYRISQL